MAIPASRFFALPPDRITPELEAAFFSGLKTANNTFKKTDVRRFAEIDVVLVAELAALRSPQASAGLFEVLDIGVSSGTTTLELGDALTRAGLDHAIVATDQSFAARIVAGPLGSRALIQPDGHFLQFELFGKALRAWNRRLDRFTGRALVNAALRRMLAPAAGRHGVDVQLVSPRLGDGRHVTLCEDDILAHNPRFIGRFDLVRAANILNLDYFSEPALRAALANVRSYLRGPGALLLLARTDKRTGTNDAALYALRDDGGLIERHRFGKGSEVAHLLDDTARA